MATSSIAKKFVIRDEATYERFKAKWTEPQNGKCESICKSPSWRANFKEKAR